jgi:hypothetical protein
MLKIEHELFGLDLPEGWTWHPEPGGGAAVPPGDPGALVVSAHPVDDPTALPPVSRMLASFLTLRGRPVATDELATIEVNGGQGVWYEYREDEHWWRLWVIGNEVAWALISYNCPQAFRESHSSELDEIMASLRLAVAM